MLAYAIRVGDRREALHRARQIFELERAAHEAQFSVFRSEVIAVLGQLTRLGVELELPGVIAARNAAYHRLLAAHDPEALWDALRSFVLSLVDAFEQCRTSVERVIAVAEAYIHQHLGEDLTLERVADAVHLSRFHFARLFKQQTGETFKAYVTRIRMQRACEMLITGSASIGEVARAVGYKDSGYFSRVFKRTTGRLPSEFQASHRSAVPSQAVR